MASFLLSHLRGTLPCAASPVCVVLLLLLLLLLMLIETLCAFTIASQINCSKRKCYDIPVLLLTRPYQGCAFIMISSKCSMYMTEDFENFVCCLQFINIFMTKCTYKNVCRWLVGSVST